MLIQGLVVAEANEIVKQIDAAAIWKVVEVQADEALRQATERKHKRKHIVVGKCFGLGIVLEEVHVAGNDVRDVAGRLRTNQLHCSDIVLGIDTSSLVVIPSAGTINHMIKVESVLVENV